MIIATGTGRCGTKTAAKLFNMHHEYNTHPYEYGKLIYPWFKQQGIHQQPFQNRARRLAVHLTGIISGHLPETLATFRDSSNLYLHFLHVLHEIDPECQVLYLWRDPFHFIRSTYFRGWHQRDIWSFRPSSNPAAAEYHCSLDADAWPGWSDVQKLAWIWTTRNAIGLDRLEHSPLDFKVVRTVDLIPMAKRLGDWMAIDYNEEANIEHQTTPKDQAEWDLFWSPERIDQVMDFPRLDVVTGWLSRLSEDLRFQPHTA